MSVAGTLYNAEQSERDNNDILCVSKTTYCMCINDFVGNPFLNPHFGVKKYRSKLRRKELSEH